MNDDTIVANILNGQVNAEGSIVHDFSEKSIADSLAAFADAHGWLSVRREVVVPGWGRLDLLLQTYDEAWAVELKVDLQQPAQIRKAFQQADGYYRYLSDSPRGLPSVDEVILVARTHSPENLADVARRYGNVTFNTLGYFMARLAVAADPEMMRARLDAARREVAVREAVYTDLLEERERHIEAAAVAALNASVDQAAAVGEPDVLDPQEVGSE